MEERSGFVIILFGRLVWVGMICRILLEFYLKIIFFFFLYIMFLIFMIIIVVMKVYGIIINYRESVFIGIVVGFFILVWIVWGFVGGLNCDNVYVYEYGDVCIVFGLFVIVIFCLFVFFLFKV